MENGQGTVVKDLDFSGMIPGQQAGFVCFNIIHYLFGIRMDRNGVKQLLFNTKGRITDRPSIKTDKLWIRKVNRPLLY